MTSAMELPLYGRVKLYETSKTQLLTLWKKVLEQNDILIKEFSKVESITPENGYFKIGTLNGEEYTCATVLLAIGRRGTPRKLGIPGEDLEKVAYRILEPELIEGKNIVVVGGGDSAIETALMLAGQNKVILSYRSEVFGRIKPKNNERLNEAIAKGLIDVRLKTNVLAIDDEEITMATANAGEKIQIKNDLVFIFAGGEMPTQFLQKIGIQITKKFGDALLKH